MVTIAALPEGIVGKDGKPLMVTRGVPVHDAAKETDNESSSSSSFGKKLDREGTPAVTKVTTRNRF